MLYCYEKIEQEMKKIINSVFFSKYIISRKKEELQAYFNQRIFVSTIFYDVGIALKFIWISKVLYFSREWLIFKKQFYSNHD